MASDGPGDVDLDLYAEIEGGEFSHEVSGYGGGDENMMSVGGGGGGGVGSVGMNVVDLNIKNENTDELYDDVMPTSANNDFPDLLNNGHDNNGHDDGTNSMSTTSPSLLKTNSTSTLYTGKRVSCYVGNLTWWTTDQDLTDAILSVGVLDLVEIKFYENKVNGQSKGFAVVTVGSEGSFRSLMDKLPKKKLHNQEPIVTFFSKHNLNQFEAQARKDITNDPNRQRNMPPNVPGLPLARPPMGMMQRPGMVPQGMGGPGPGMGVGGPPGGLHRPMQQMGMQPRPQMLGMQQNQRLLGPGGPMGGGGPLQPGSGQPLVRPPQGGAGLIPNPHGPGLIRGPMQPGHRMQHDGGPRGPQPRNDWERAPHPNFQQGNGMPPRGPQPGSLAPGQVPPGAHPGGFFQGPPNGLMHPHHHPHNVPPHGQNNHHPSQSQQPQQPQQQQQQQPGGGSVPSQQQMPPNSHHENPYYRSTKNEPQDLYVSQINEDEFQEIMEKNKNVSSSAISRAVTDASMGDYPSAIETLVMAISLIKQSKIANDDRCKILISSLQDTLKGIEDKYYSNGRNRSNSRDSRERTRRSRSRDSRERDTRRREKHRHRSRSRERRDYYDEPRYHRSRH